MADKITVTLEDKELEVVADNRDYVAWDITRAKRGWPQMADAPILAMTFLAWNALYRTGKTETKLDDFLAKCSEVMTPDEHGEVIPF